MPLHKRMTSIPFEQRTLEAVPVELDGPQLITALDAAGKRYLGLFADRRDDGREMWLYAPISLGPQLATRDMRGARDQSLRVSR